MLIHFHAVLQPFRPASIVGMYAVGGLILGVDDFLAFVFPLKNAAVQIVNMLKTRFLHSFAHALTTVAY